MAAARLRAAPTPRSDKQVSRFMRRIISDTQKHVNSVTRIHRSAVSRFTAAMKDIDEIRRENMALLERESGGATAAAERVGMSQAQWSNLRAGAADSKTGKPRGMRKETARKIEAGARKPAGWLDVDHRKSNLTTPRLTTDYAVFPLLDAHAARGNGYMNADYPEVVRSIALTAAEATELVGSANRAGTVQVILAKGDSMTPTIEPRDLLFVDTAVREYSGEGIYLLRHGGELLCKRLSMSGRTLTVTSDNQKTPSWKWKDRDKTDTIIGRVLCALPMTFKRF